MMGLSNQVTAWTVAVSTKTMTKALDRKIAAKAPKARWKRLKKHTLHVENSRLEHSTPCGIMAIPS